MTTRRRATVPSVHAIERAPVICAKTLARQVVRLRELQAGVAPSFAHETIEWRHDVVQGWIAAFRETGRCKRCGTALTDAESVDRGIGPDCWASKLTDDERTAVTAWVETQRAAALTARLTEPV